MPYIQITIISTGMPFIAAELMKIYSIIETPHRLLSRKYSGLLNLTSILNYSEGPWCKRNVNTAMDQSQIQRIASTRRPRPQSKIKTTHQTETGNIWLHKRHSTNTLANQIRHLNRMRKGLAVSVCVVYMSNRILSLVCRYVTYWCRVLDGCRVEKWAHLLML